MRRAGGYSREDRLERIYANMRPDYKRYIKRNEARTITELMTLAADLEGIEDEERAIRKEEKKSAPALPNVAAAYDRATHCWKCKQRGHTRLYCKRRRKNSALNAAKTGCSRKSVIRLRETPGVLR